MLGTFGAPDGTYLVIVPHATVADVDVGMREDAARTPTPMKKEPKKP